MGQFGVYEDAPEVEPKEEEEQVELEEAPVEKAACSFSISEMQLRRMLWLRFLGFRVGFRRAQALAVALERRNPKLKGPCRSSPYT